MMRRWLQEFTLPRLLALILSICLLSGCVSKQNIKIPEAQPLPHPALAKMQSLSLEEKGNVTYFGQSKKYYKNGIRVVVLSGEPYEIGYARGALLKDEIRDWVRFLLYLVKKMSWGTSYGENRLRQNAKDM
jgi:hypothetical protein